MLLVEWGAVGDACADNYYYDKVDWVITLGIIIFIVNCCGSCATPAGGESMEQEGEGREENVARDSTAETATLAGKSMKQTNDASYP